MNRFLPSHPLLRFLALHLVFGLVVASLAIGGLIGFDLFGLRRLIFADQSPLLAMVLLGGGFVVTFSSTVMGSAIMSLGRQHDDDGGSRATEPVDQVVPAVVTEPRR